MNKTKKSKQEKGITLIALIITIVVLLILAVVTIRAVQGDGIIQHAKNATQKYSKAQIEEAVRTLQYQALLDSNGASSALTLAKINEQEWITNGSASAVQDETTGDITITIATTGETVESIVVPGKITSSTTDSVVGKYYMLGSTDYYLDLKENGEFESNCSGTLTGTYTYDQTNSIINLAIEGFEDTEKMTYTTIGTNKILYSLNIEDNGSGQIFSSNGTAGLEAPEGTYTGTGSIMQYSGKELEIIISGGNLVVNLKSTGDNVMNKKAILLNGVIYVYTEGDDSVSSILKVSGDNLIGCGYFSSDSSFTKVTE